MNPKAEWRLVRIGALVALALLVLAVAILGITSRHKVFERKVEYFTFFPDAAGLKEGAGVWFQGVEVGFIQRITFSRDPDQQQVEVRYKVSADLIPRIRTGTRASIKTLGLLGDKYLSLETPSGAQNQPILLPGNQVPADRQLNLEALGRGAEDLMNNTVELSKNLRDLSGEFVKGKGALPRLVGDPEVGAALVKNLVEASANLEKVSAALAEGRGLAGRLASDPVYGEAVSRDLAESVRRTREILEGLQEGKGAAGALLHDEEGRKMVANMAAAAETLARVAAAVERPGTVGNRLFLDEAYGRELGDNLLSISRSLDSILKKIDGGEGTVGALINDRDVYNSMLVLSEGMKRSSLIRWYLTKIGEHGVKDLEKKRKEQAPQP